MKQKLNNRKPNKRIQQTEDQQSLTPIEPTIPLSKKLLFLIDQTMLGLGIFIILAVSRKFIGLL